MYYIFQAVRTNESLLLAQPTLAQTVQACIYKTLSTSSWLLCEMPQSNNNFKDFKIMFLVRIILNHC
jgi:hypothetical protein